MTEGRAEMALTPPSTPPTPTTACENNSFDDVFSTSRTPSPTRPSKQHPTDIPHLRTTHNTAGYRAGISATKDSAVQPGFDEGYPLGATFGLRTGYLLGVLEGITTATRVDGNAEEEYKRLRELLAQARRELSVEKIFTGETWNSDGTWGYSVPGEGDGDVTFCDVVEAHPVIKKWGAVVEDELRRAEVSVPVLDDGAWDAWRVGDKW